MSPFPTDNPAPSQPPGGRPVTPRKTTTFDDLVSGGAPVWTKMIGGAVFTTMFVLLTIGKSLFRTTWRDDVGIAWNIPLLALVVAGSSLVGALLGAALTMKDVVTQRMAGGQRVGFPLKLLFGYGMLSLLAWIPLAIVVTIVIAVATL